jgi:alpha-amylase/alpha-mannosidase (GH57 family)
MPDQIHHALVLNLHQPWGNLGAMLEDPAENWHAKECLYAYDRIPRAVAGREDVARVHVSMSGSLLEALSNAEFQSRVYGIVKCGDMLWQYRNPAIDMLGTGYYHPVLPLIPDADRAEHVGRWLGIARHLFWREHFNGFWPPELGFSMDLIPVIRRFGFRYVIVDSEQIVPMTPMRWEEVRYRPHVCKFGNDEIVIIPRDRELSVAQEGGMDPGWFIHELHERTKWCSFVPLVCTATDGDNGGWFRNVRWESNFWGGFYHPLVDRVRNKQSEGVEPIFIHDYLDRHGAHGQVIVRTGSWNTGEHSGIGFVQWTGSSQQRDAWQRLADVSRAIHDARWSCGQRGWPHEEARLIEEAMWRVLRAETSCHFFWGEAWVSRAHAGMDDALMWLEKAKVARG